MADLLFRQPENNPETLAKPFINENIPDVKTALDGARAILIEQFAEDAELIGQITRKNCGKKQVFMRKIIEGKQEEGEKFKDYLINHELIHTMPSHRALAILRGRNEGILMVSLKYQPDETPITEQSEYEKIIIQHFWYIK